MANLRTALSGARPVVAGMVAFLPRKIGCPVILRSGQNVMLVRPIATPIDQIAILIQSRSFDDVRVDVKLIEVDGNQFASGVVPGARSDSVARGNGTAFFDLGAEICAPRAPGGARRLGELRAMGIGPVKAAQIRALAHADARDKKTHGVLVCRKERRTRQGQNSERGQDPKNVHVSLPIPDKDSPFGASRQLERDPIRSERQVAGKRRVKRPLRDRAIDRGSAFSTRSACAARPGNLSRMSVTPHASHTRAEDPEHRIGFNLELRW